MEGPEMISNRYSHLFMLVFILMLSSPGFIQAAFYCDEIPASCNYNVVGWQNTCGSSCTVCGSAHCPEEPEIASLELLSQSSCRAVVIESNRLRTCNTALIEDSGLRGYAHLFQYACEENSICYHNQNYSKQRCDDNFKQNIQHICQNQYASQPPLRWWLNDMNKSNLKSCLYAASIWVDNVKNSGAGTFNNDQNWGLRHCPID